MKKLCVVLGIAAMMFGLAAPAMAAGATLPVEGGSAVWVQPIGGEPGSMGATISLTLPSFVGTDVRKYLKAEIVVHSEGSQVRVDPGLSLSLTTDVGIPVKVGLVALPLTRYKVGWIVGATIFQTTI